MSDNLTLPWIDMSASPRPEPSAPLVPSPPVIGMRPRDRWWLAELCEARAPLAVVTAAEWALNRGAKAFMHWPREPWYLIVPVGFDRRPLREAGWRTCKYPLLRRVQWSPA